MDIVNSEKSGNSLSKIFGSNTPKDLTAPLSDFEKELFKDGVYEFNLDNEISKSEEGYRSYKDWFRTAGWEPDRAQESLSDFVSSESWELAWKQAFSGRIPKSWHIWHNVSNTFEEAGERNVQLSPILINAGVSHDHHLVVNEAGKSQKLSPQQLGLVLGRDDIPTWNSDQVIAAQKAKGMTNQEFNEAEVYATEVREKIRRARAKNKRGQLTSPKLQLRSKNQGGEV